MQLTWAKPIFREFGKQVCVIVRTITMNPDGLSRATAANNFN
ncbi:hypothetical protein BN938_1075 [Mucinivorans hirudinis]|uniref:Uncharacterized protein n=1 Tax=Mucinivorans hirudinis TaxID=1433126 RepID=A0A060R7E0_9BACT|nr:hypothetical protein BN938_1075 [Mucinivorans hirudinis]